MSNEELKKLNEELILERDELKIELQRIKTRYSEHLDNLNNEISKLRIEAKKRVQAFVELMIHLQDVPESK